MTSYADGAHVLLHSDRRADGIVIEALMDTKRGPAEENAFVLMALDRYFRTYEKETPDFVAKLWLGDGFAGEHAFRGRTTEFFEVDVPMGYLTETKGALPSLGPGLPPAGSRATSTDGEQGSLIVGESGSRSGRRPGPVPLTLAMEGDQGRLYYRVGMRYAPKSLRKRTVLPIQPWGSADATCAR